MKRKILSIALLLSLACLPVLILSGCKTSATVPLAPGYQNAADQQMGEILAGARSFYTTIQSESASGKMVLSATEKTAFNDFGAAINAAEQVYLGYHAGTSTQAQAQAAIDAVKTKQAALPTPGGN